MFKFWMWVDWVCVCLSVSNCYSLRQSSMALPIVQLSCGNWLMGNWPPSSTARMSGSPSGWLVMRLSSAWRPAPMWACSRSWAAGPESPPWQKPSCCVSWLTTARASSPCRPSRSGWTRLTLFPAPVASFDVLGRVLLHLIIQIQLKILYCPLQS